MFSFFNRKKLAEKSEKLQDSQHKTKVSFCITHKNRFKYLKQTLRKNLDDNISDAEMIEFILVDFASEENITSWVKENFTEELKSGYLKYYFTEELPKWQASIAKNTAHYLASGVVVVNLDCDNFIGKDGGKFVLDNFKNETNDIIFWQYSKKKLDGSFGRIGATKEAFNTLGGYDESFLPMGFQDGDLRDRLKAYGCKLVHKANTEYNKAIVNDKYTPQSMSWKKMNEANQKTSKENIKNGRLTANNGLYGIRKNILQLQSDDMTLKIYHK